MFEKEQSQQSSERKRDHGTFKNCQLLNGWNKSCKQKMMKDVAAAIGKTGLFKITGSIRGSGFKRMERH